MLTFKKEQKKKEGRRKEISIDEPINGSEGERGDDATTLISLLPGGEDPGVIVKEELALANLVKLVVKFLVAYKQSSKQEKKEAAEVRVKYYQGFLTFDITKAVREDGKFQERACSRTCNDVLFPVMLDIMLTHLMFGEFRRMCNVANNPLKDENSLGRRKMEMEACFGVTRKEVNNYSEKYDRFRKAVRKKYTEAHP